MKARIFLNNTIRDNYAFFCPDSNLHLSLSNPVGTIDRVTIAILRGLARKTLVDVDGVIDIKNKCFKEKEIVAEKEPVEVIEVATTKQENIEEKTEPVPPKKKPRAKKK